MRKKISFVTLGIPSLFFIFSVLCMVIFSLLSFRTSQSDLAMSTQTMEQTTQYYQACQKAADLCLKIEDFSIDIYQNTEDKNAYYQQMAFLSDTVLFWNETAKQYSFEIPYSDTQALSVILNIFYPLTEEDSFLEIDTWKTIFTRNWTPDTNLHLFQGE